MRLFRFFLFALALLGLTACAGRPGHAPAMLTEAAVMRAEVNGVSLGYRMLGHGPPLLLLMGYGGTMDVWDPAMVSELTRTRTVILMDNRGMGYSTADAAPITIERMADDAAGLLRHLRMDSADILGWSMGSVIAQEMALTHPDAVGKLVLYGTAVDPEPVKRALDAMGAMTREEFLAQLFPEAWTRRHPNFLQRLPVPAIAPSAQTTRRQYDALQQWPGTRTRLQSLEKSVLIIAGTNDTVTPPAQALDAARLLPHAWLVRFDQGGHWLMYQAGSDMARTVENFLSVREDLSGIQP